MMNRSFHAPGTLRLGRARTLFQKIECTAGRRLHLINCKAKEKIVKEKIVDVRPTEV
jgi:hypothetical protein